MRIFLDNFHQCVKYTSQIIRHQSESRREENFTDQNLYFFSYLYTEYLNLDSSSGSSRNNERANLAQEIFNFSGVTNHLTENCFKKIRKDAEKYCAASD